MTSLTLALAGATLAASCVLVTATPIAAAPINSIGRYSSSGGISSVARYTRFSRIRRVPATITELPLTDRTTAPSAITSPVEVVERTTLGIDARSVTFPTGSSAGGGAVPPRSSGGAANPPTSTISVTPTQPAPPQSNVGQIPRTAVVPAPGSGAALLGALGVGGWFASRKARRG